MDAIKFIEAENKSEFKAPEFRSGDTIAVRYKIIEGAKERIQSYKGDVIQINGSGNTKTFTVRKNV